MKIAQLILGAVIAVVLAGCGTAAPPQSALASAPGKRVIVGVATLASAGSFDEESASAWTRHALLQHNAARLLREGRITRAVAIDIQGHADTVRMLLDGANVDARNKQIDQARARLQNARQLLSDAEAKLKVNP